MQFASAHFRVIFKNHIVFDNFEDLDCWESSNQPKPGFFEIEHRLVNFSSLGPVPCLNCVNDKIKNTSFRKLFKQHQTKFSN